MLVGFCISIWQFFLSGITIFIVLLGLASSTRRRGMWSRRANWECCMFLLLNHRLQYQKVLRKDPHLEVLFQRMEMPTVLTSHKWVLDLFCFPFSLNFWGYQLECLFLLCISGSERVYWATWRSRQICRGKLELFLFFFSEYMHELLRNKLMISPGDYQVDVNFNDKSCIQVFAMSYFFSWRF